METAEAQAQAEAQALRAQELHSEVQAEGEPPQPVGTVRNAATRWQTFFSAADLVRALSPGASPEAVLDELWGADDGPVRVCSLEGPYLPAAAAWRLVERGRAAPARRTGAALAFLRAAEALPRAALRLDLLPESEPPPCGCRCSRCLSCCEHPCEACG